MSIVLEQYNPMSDFAQRLAQTAQRDMEFERKMQQSAMEQPMRMGAMTGDPRFVQRAERAIGTPLSRMLQPQGMQQPMQTEMMEGVEQGPGGGMEEFFAAIQTATDPFDPRLLLMEQMGIPAAGAKREFLAQQRLQEQKLRTETVGKQAASMMEGSMALSRARPMLDDVLASLERVKTGPLTAASLAGSIAGLGSEELGSAMEASLSSQEMNDLRNNLAILGRQLAQLPGETLTATQAREIGKKLTTRMPAQALVSQVQALEKVFTLESTANTALEELRAVAAAEGRALTAEDISEAYRIAQEVLREIEEEARADTRPAS